MQKTYYEKGVLHVTDRFVRARGRSIKLSTIESVDLSHTAFFAALLAFGGMALTALLWIDILGFFEIVFLAAIGSTALYWSWQFGTLTVFSKLARDGWQIHGWMSSLLPMRAAIETAMHDQGKGVGTGGGAASSSHDQEDDHDEADDQEGDDGD